MSRAAKSTLGTACHWRPGLSLAVALLVGGQALAGNPPIRPDISLTPGAVFPVTAADVCQPGYAKSARHVDGKTKALVYREYGIEHHQPGAYEIDHLISLGLGGSNDIRNLWPESLDTQPWNARAKDRLEERLHKLVCDGGLSLDEAQTAIAKDWIGAYQKYVEQH